MSPDLPAGQHLPRIDKLSQESEAMSSVCERVIF